jgi:hypothetical protein
MPIKRKRLPPALKHGAYSEAALLPGEDPAEFKALHKGLIADFRPFRMPLPLFVATRAPWARTAWRTPPYSARLRVAKTGRTATSTYWWNLSPGPKGRSTITSASKSMSPVSSKGQWM